MLKLVSGQSLRGRATVAAAWTVTEIGVSHSIRLAGNLILSHLLLPGDFGQMGIVTAIIVGVNLLTDVGIQQSMVRSPRGDDPHFGRVAWTVQLARSSVIALGVFLVGLLILLLSPHFAAPGTVFAENDLPWLVMVASLAVLLQGAQSVNVWLAARTMLYSRTTLLTVISQVISLIAMTTLALIYSSPWALLAGMIVGAVVSTSLSHMIIPGPKMALAWDGQIANELWTFGKWIIGSSSLTFVATNADKVLLGSLLDTQRFGHYVIATTWVGAVTMVLQRLSVSVGFPVLSETNLTRPEDMGRTFRRFSIAFDLLCVVGFALTVVIVPALIQMLYPPLYAPSARMIPLLSVLVLLQHFSPLARLFLAQGDSRTGMIAAAAQAASLCVVLPISYSAFGLPGALGALIVSPSIGSIVYIWRGFSCGMSPVRHIVWLGSIIATTALALAFTGE